MFEENNVCLWCCGERTEVKLLNNVEKLRSHHQDNYPRPASRIPAPEVRIVEHGDGVLFSFCLITVNMHRLKSRLTIKISKVLCFTLLLKDWNDRGDNRSHSHSQSLELSCFCWVVTTDCHDCHEYIFIFIFIFVFIKIIFRNPRDRSFFLL